MNNTAPSARSYQTTTALPRAQAWLDTFIQFEGLLIKLCWLFVETKQRTEQGAIE